MKYIDSEKLIAEIERQIEEEKNNITEDTKPYYGARQQVRSKILRIITFLQQEQPDVDLEKSRNLIRATLNGVTRLGSLCDDQAIEHAVDVLINELGLNARKEE